MVEDKRLEEIKKEAFDFAKRILPNGYQAKYAMAGGGEIVEDKRLEEIIDDAFSPENSSIKRKQRELEEAKKAIDDGQWYSANDPRILEYQQKLKILEDSKKNSPHMMRDAVGDVMSREHKKRITQVVGAEWKFTDETLDEYKKRIYGNTEANEA